jgi:hypothetical protein
VDWLVVASEGAMRPLPHPSARPNRVVAAPLHSLIAQSVERRTVNPQVPGSSPGRGATDFKGTMPGREMGLFVFRTHTDRYK